MPNSSVTVKRLHSEWLYVKTSLSSEFGRRASPSVLSPLSFKSHATLWGHRKRPWQTASQQKNKIYMGPIKPLKQQQLTRAVESNKNHNVYIITLLRLSRVPVQGVGRR